MIANRQRFWLTQHILGLGISTYSCNWRDFLIWNIIIGNKDCYNYKHDFPGYRDLPFQTMYGIHTAIQCVKHYIFQNKIKFNSLSLYSWPPYTIHDQYMINTRCTFLCCEVIGTRENRGANEEILVCFPGGAVVFGTLSEQLAFDLHCWPVQRCNGPNRINPNQSVGLLKLHYNQMLHIFCNNFLQTCHPSGCGL